MATRPVSARSILAFCTVALAPSVVFALPAQPSMSTNAASQQGTRGDSTRASASRGNTSTRSAAARHSDEFVQKFRESATPMTHDAVTAAREQLIPKVVSAAERGVNSYGTSGKPLVKLTPALLRGMSHAGLVNLASSIHTPELKQLVGNLAALTREHSFVENGTHATGFQKTSTSVKALPTAQRTTFGANSFRLESSVERATEKGSGYTPDYHFKVAYHDSENHFGGSKEVTAHMIVHSKDGSTRTMSTALKRQNDGSYAGGFSASHTAVVEHVDMYFSGNHGTYDSGFGKNYRAF